MYKPTSHYNDTPIHQNRFLGYYVHRPIPPHKWDREFTLTEYRYVHRPDLLAADLYGDDRLFFVIPIRNEFQDLYFDLEYGIKIIIPHPNYVRSLF